MFQKKAKQSVTPEEIRDWAAPLLQRKDPKYQNHPEDTLIEIADMPMFLKSIEAGGPETAFLCYEDDGKKSYIIVAWGGGFGHWGLEIGDKDFSASSDDTKDLVQWDAGIYFFKQTK